MGLFYPTAAAARDYAAEVAKDPRVASVDVQMEPYNGWVVVVVPARYELPEYVGLVELQDGRPRVAPTGKARPTPLQTAPDRAIGPRAPSEAGAAPSRGSTARVWAIADGIGKVDRAAIIAACVADGIHPSTAATQYSKWKKARHG